MAAAVPAAAPRAAAAVRVHGEPLADRRRQPATPWRGGEDELIDIDQLDDDLDAPRERIAWDLLDDPYAGGGTKGDFLDAYQHQPGETEVLAELGELRAGISALTGVSPDLLERLMGETLDLCSHRLGRVDRLVRVAAAA